MTTNVIYINNFGNAVFVKGLKSASRRIAVNIEGMTIDGLANGISNYFLKSSTRMSYAQTGLVRSYVVYFGLFTLILIFIFLISPEVQA